MERKYFNLREVPANFSRILGVAFSIFILGLILSIILMLVISVLIMLNADQLGIVANLTTFLMIGLVSGGATLFVNMIFFWIIIARRWKYQGARIAFVRESLLDSGLAAKEAA